MTNSSTGGQALSFSDEKLDQKVEIVEEVPLTRPLKYYAASTEEEKKLDKSLNLKLDFFVVSLLAVNFLVFSAQSLVLAHR
jgi:hypothetical protein